MSKNVNRHWLWFKCSQSCELVRSHKNKSDFINEKLGWNPLPDVRRWELRGVTLIKINKTNCFNSILKKELRTAAIGETYYCIKPIQIIAIPASVCTVQKQRKQRCLRCCSKVIRLVEKLLIVGGDETFTYVVKVTISSHTQQHSATVAWVENAMLNLHHCSFLGLVKRVSM